MTAVAVWVGRASVPRGQRTTAVTGNTSEQGEQAYWERVRNPL